MELLHALSEQEHFKVLTALWPYFLDKGIQEPVPAGARNDGAPLLIETLASRYGFESQRLSPGFRADVKRLSAEHPRGKRPSPRWTYTIGDGTHPSKAGTALAANILERPVRELLGLEVTSDGLGNASGMVRSHRDSSLPGLPQHLSKLIIN